MNATLRKWVGLFTIIFLVLSCEKVGDKFVSNINNNQESIHQLIQTFHQLPNSDVGIYIEVEKPYSKQKIDIQYIPSKIRLSNKNKDDKEIMEVLNLLEWSTADLDLLSLKLKEANCISIETNKGYDRVGFERLNFGKYYYRIYGSPIDEKTKEFVEKECQLKYYTDLIIFEWGSGALGGQCFPGFVKSL
jgi:hypothetical protein